jgi:hypothetical protein
MACLHWAWILAVFTLGQTPRCCAQETTRLELTASTQTPWIGQNLELQLSLRLPPQTQPYPLAIPWLEAEAPEYEWLLPPEEWICRHTLPRADSLVLQWRNHKLYAPQISSGVYALRWQVRVRGENEEEPRLQWGAVTLGRWRSQPLILPIQRPPSQALSSSVWDLGVGSYSLSALWKPAMVALGEETTLELSVQGAGDLAALAAPRVSAQSGWDRDAYLLETAPETWRANGSQRVFRFHVRPRRLGARQPPSLLVRFLDPQHRQVQTLRLSIPTLHVVAGDIQAQESTASLPFSTDWRQQLSQRSEQTGSRLWISRAALGLPFLFVLSVLLRSMLRRYCGNWLMQGRWRRAARSATRQIQRAAVVDPGTLKTALARFLSAGLERPVTPEWPALQAALLEIPPSEKVPFILKIIQELEFGPPRFFSQDEARRNALLWFQAWEPLP